MSQPDPYGQQPTYGAPSSSSPYLAQQPQPGSPQYASPNGYYPGLQVGTNPWAIASLVLGIFGTAIFAVIAGHLALSQIRRTGESGRGLAIAGLILGYLEIVLWSLFFAALMGFIVIGASQS